MQISLNFGRVRMDTGGERRRGRGVGVRSLDFRPAAPEKTCPLIPDFGPGRRRARLRFAIDFKV